MTTSTPNPFAYVEYTGKSYKPLRYKRLQTLVWLNKPKRIVEVGTWKGLTAECFLQNSPESEYWGFDLWEDADADLDERENNGKRHISMAEVRDRLARYGDRVHLIRGDTRETLRKHAPEGVNFAFIDGGHSVDTIASDWGSLAYKMAPGAIWVFDDYYEGVEPEFIQQFGSNRLYHLRKATFPDRVELLPETDKMNRPGTVRMWVMREPE